MCCYTIAYNQQQSIGRFRPIMPVDSRSVYHFIPASGGSRACLRACTLNEPTQLIDRATSNDSQSVNMESKRQCCEWHMESLAPTLGCIIDKNCPQYHSQVLFAFTIHKKFTVIRRNFHSYYDCYRLFKN